MASIYDLYCIDSVINNLNTKFISLKNYILVIVYENEYNFHTEK